MMYVIPSFHKTYGENKKPLLNNIRGRQGVENTLTIDYLFLFSDASLPLLFPFPVEEITEMAGLCRNTRNTFVSFST